MRRQQDETKKKYINQSKQIAHRIIQKVSIIAK
jgi:hypothetical protein